MKRKNILFILAALLLFSLACNFITEMGNPDTSEEEMPAAIPPTEAPTQSAEDVAEPTSAAPADNLTNNPCNNVFYPLVPGNQLVYKNYSPEGETQISMTVTDVADSQATMDMLDMSTGIVFQSTVGCEEGAIKSYPLVNLDTIFGDMVEGELNMAYVSGEIAPSEETLVANNWDMTWESNYIMNGEMAFSSEGETISVLINDSPVDMTWRIESTGQSLTVPAGTYDNVVVVKREMTTKISIDMGGFNVDSNLILESTHWFEPYIGMLKMNVENVTAEVQGMTFPLATDQIMELTEVHFAE